MFPHRDSRRETGNRIKIVRCHEEENVGAMREAPAAGSTPNIQRPTSNAQRPTSNFKQRFAVGFCPWTLGVGRRAFDVEMLPRVLMRLPCAAGR